MYSHNEAHTDEPEVSVVVCSLLLSFSLVSSAGMLSVALCSWASLVLSALFFSCYCCRCCGFSLLPHLSSPQERRQVLKISSPSLYQRLYTAYKVTFMLCSMVVVCASCKDLCLKYVWTALALWGLRESWMKTMTMKACASRKREQKMLEKLFDGLL